MRNYIEMINEEHNHPHARGEDEWFKLFFQYVINVDEAKRQIASGKIKPKVVQYPIKTIGITVFGMESEEFGSNDFNDPEAVELLSGPPVNRKLMKDIPADKMDEAPLFVMFNADKALAIIEGGNETSDKEFPILIDGNHRVVKKYLMGDKGKVDCQFIMWDDVKKICFPIRDRKTTLADMEVTMVSESKSITENEIMIPKTPDTLPMVMKNAITGGDHNALADPHWTKIGDLPSMFLNGLRMMAEEVFSQFTTTPLEEIQMMSTVMEDEQEVRKMMAWIKQNGQKEDEMTMDFSRIMPGAVATVQVWRAEGFQFALTHDFSGYYIYGWPENNPQLTDRRAGGAPQIS